MRFPTIEERAEAVALSPAERHSLLADIGRIGALLGPETSDSDGPPLSLSPSDVQASTPSSPLERIHLLDAVWQRAQSALHALLRQTDTILQTETRSVPLAQSRGNPSTLRALARHPNVLSASRSSRSAADRTPCQPSVQERFFLTSPVTLANRAVKTWLLAIEAEATVLERLARFCAETDAAERIARVARSARSWLGSPFFRALPRLDGAQMSALASNASALWRVPAYRALNELRLLTNRPLAFDWTGCPFCQLPTLPEWHLYEIWCFLRVAEALHALGWHAHGGDAVRWTTSGLRVELATGRASRLRFRRAQETVTLLYQPLFPSANQQTSVHSSAATDPETRSRFLSRSHAMQPDMALQINARLYLLDPKFRAYASPGAEQDDVDKMHAYRDAIVRVTGKHARVPAVSEAWCLFPGTPRREHTQESPVRAYPSPTPDAPFGTAGIGALRLRPGDTASWIHFTRLLEVWLPKMKNPETELQFRASSARFDR